MPIPSKRILRYICKATRDGDTPAPKEYDIAVNAMAPRIVRSAE